MVRISGPQSLSIARKLTAIDPRPRYAHYCVFRDGKGRIIDNGILLYFQGPYSFTGEDVVELHGHGGYVAPGLLLKEVLDSGARLARAGEFTERAYLNDKIDLVQAEAVADLVDSATEQAARSAARSLEGEFSERIQNVVRQLVDVRVLVEGSLDFPEEETDFLAHSDVHERLQKVIVALDDLLDKSRRGMVLREGLNAVITGRTNVGKSSLMNRLFVNDRSIVTDFAGTTRDIIEDRILLGGIHINIADTAGIRTPENPVEKEGIRRSLHAIGKADIVLLVTDQMGHEETGGDLPQAADFENKTFVYVHNKIDLHNKPAVIETVDRVAHVYVSARTGAGMDLLTDTLKSALQLMDDGEGLLLARERHIRALETARRLVDNGIAACVSSGSAELLADELRSAQKSLGEITGEFHADDLIGEIFSRFCIGK